jgi:hypothetical protein
MNWPMWSYAEQAGVARYASPDAARWCALEENRGDLQTHPDACVRITQALYGALLNKGIRYNLEPFHPAQGAQRIRTPLEVLTQPCEGTCLDLALCFCGLALANELLPVLVVVRGHAFVAVATAHGLRDWSALRPTRQPFKDSPVTTDLAAVRKLVERGELVAVECTGFARSEALSTNKAFPETQGRADGVMSFERAVAAGREQFEARPDGFAVDSPWRTTATGSNPGPCCSRPSAAPCHTSPGASARPSFWA